MDGRETVQKEIENFLRLARRYNITVCGFAFSVDPPMMTNFGNCSDAHELKLYEQLTKLCQQQRDRGKAEYISVSEVN